MQETPEGNAKACFQERVLLSKTKVDLCKEKFKILLLITEKY
jgi:hypothetical protein